MDINTQSILDGYWHHGQLAVALQARQTRAFLERPCIKLTCTRPVAPVHGKNEYTALDRLTGEIVVFHAYPVFKETSLWTTTPTPK